MIAASQILHGTFATCIALAAAAALVSLAWQRAVLLGRWVSAAAVGFGLLGLAARSVASGHLPIFGTFENTYTAAWSLVLLGTLISFLTPFDRAWRLAMPWAVVLLLYGSRFRSEHVPLTISEQSLWVDVHVVFAWIAFSALAAATTMSIARLLNRRVGSLSADKHESVHQRFLLIGFLAFSTMLLLGAWYLYVLFGTFWQWEIVETLCLVTWLMYAVLIHGRLFYRWSGKLYHAGVVAVLPLMLLSYWIWSVFPGSFHFFDIPLVRPY